MSKTARITFDNTKSPFFDTLKNKVDNYFQKNNVSQLGNIRLFSKTIILYSTLIALYTWVVFYTPESTAVSLLLCAMIGLNFAIIGFNVMHDGAHGSYSNNKVVNELMGYSLNIMGGNSFLWKIKHNVIHHTFTNINGVDDDIDIKPFMRVNADQPRYSMHRFQQFYWFILYGFTYLLWIFVLDFQKYFSGKVANIKFKKMTPAEHITFWVSKAFYIFTFVVFPMIKLGWLEGLVGYAVMASFCGLVIATVFQLAHVVEGAEFPRPNEVTNKIENEWAIHQMNTTANFSTDSKIVSWLVGGLNYQIEHHLFPKISHIHYPNIRNLVKETCAEFNVNYLEYPTVLSALRSHISLLKELGKAA